MSEPNASEKFAEILQRRADVYQRIAECILIDDETPEVAYNQNRLPDNVLAALSWFAEHGELIDALQAASERKFSHLTADGIATIERLHLEVPDVRAKSPPKREATPIPPTSSQVA